MAKQSMKYSVIAALLGVILSCSSAVSADQIWSDFSVSYLRGEDYLNPFAGYEYGSKGITIEHASGHNWGSTFTFVDALTNDDGSADEIYGEIGANVDVAKLEYGVINSLYLAGQIEHQAATSGFTNYLYGFGVGLVVPGADYFNVVYYRRINDKLVDIQKADHNQISINWSFESGNFRFDGFWDIVDATHNKFGSVASGFLLSPQLKYNIGPALGMTSGRLDVGLEYVYWKNKFGIDGQDEKNANLLIKWHF